MEKIQTQFRLTKEERDFLLKVGDGRMTDGLRLLISISSKAKEIEKSRKEMESPSWTYTDQEYRDAGL